jgi:manganese transport protein
MNASRGRSRVSQVHRPGILVTVGFIDPATGVEHSAGSGFGYSLLWVVSLSTIMLIFLQHNAAHLGIATGLCISEAASEHLPRPLARTLQISAIGAGVATAWRKFSSRDRVADALRSAPFRRGG